MMNVYDFVDEMRLGCMVCHMRDTRSGVCTNPDHMLVERSFDKASLKGHIRAEHSINEVVDAFTEFHWNYMKWNHPPKSQVQGKVKKSKSRSRPKPRLKSKSKSKKHRPKI